MTDLLNQLKGVRRNGDGWTCRCPAHADKENSLSVRHADGKWLLKCFAGCTVEQIASAIGLKVSDLFEEDVSDPSGNRSTDQPKNGLTLEQYAAAKKLPPNFLRKCGLSDVIREGAPAVRISVSWPSR